MHIMQKKYGSHFKIAGKIIKGGNSNLKEMKFQSKQVTVVTVYYDIVFLINAKIFFLITKQHESIDWLILKYLND